MRKNGAALRLAVYPIASMLGGMESKTSNRKDAKMQDKLNQIRRRIARRVREVMRQGGEYVECFPSVLEIETDKGDCLTIEEHRLINAAARGENTNVKDA